MKELDKDRSSLQGDAQVTFLKSPLQVDDVAVKLLSHVQLFATLWTAAHQAPLSMGFSRQEYWSGLPFPSPVDHILSDLSTMPTRLGWLHRAWLSFIELDKAVVLV